MSYIKIFDTMKKAFLFWTGSALIIIGLISLLFPFIPGFILILLGLALCTRGSENLVKKILSNKWISFIKLKLYWLKPAIYKTKGLSIFNSK